MNKPLAILLVGDNCANCKYCKEWLIHEGLFDRVDRVWDAKDHLDFCEERTIQSIPAMVIGEHVLIGLDAIQRLAVRLLG